MRTCKFMVIALILLLVMTGCAVQAAPNAPQAPAANEPQAPSAAPADTPAPQSTDEQPKEATWCIDISDTQQITDEMGLLWDYTLTFHASKPGGTDPIGQYTGEAILTIAPDMESAQALAAREGTQLLAMLFDYHAECENLTFTIAPFSQDAYAAQMKEHTPTTRSPRLIPGMRRIIFALRVQRSTLRRNPSP